MPDDDEEAASTSGAASTSMRSFEDVEKMPDSSTVESLAAKVVNLSPRKDVRGGASYFRIAGLQVGE